MNAAIPLPEPTWGALVAAYFVLIGLPSGLGLIGWWLASTGPAGIRLERYANYLSLAALAVVGVLLIADLGRPERFFLMLTRFDNLASPISVGAKLIALKSVLLVVVILGAYRAARAITTDPMAAPARPAFSPRGTRWAYIAVRVALLATSFALAIYPAAVLSRSWASPLAGTPGAALLFLLTSLLLGVCAAAVIAGLTMPQADLAALATPLRRALLVLLAGFGIALAMEALTVVGDPRLNAPVSALSSGAYAVAWWGGVLGLGVTTPAAGLRLFPSSRAVLVAAGITGAIGACLARYLLFAVVA